MNRFCRVQIQIVQIQVLQIVQISHGGQSVCCRPVNYITAVRRHGKTSLACSRARGIQIVDHVSFSNQGLPGHQWHPDCSASKCRVIDTVTILRRNLHKVPTVRGRVPFLPGYDKLLFIYYHFALSIQSLIHLLSPLIQYYSNRKVLYTVESYQCFMFYYCTTGLGLQISDSSPGRCQLLHISNLQSRTHQLLDTSGGGLISQPATLFVENYPFHKKYSTSDNLFVVWDRSDQNNTFEIFNCDYFGYLLPKLRTRKQLHKGGEVSQLEDVLKCHQYHK